MNAAIKQQQKGTVVIETALASVVFFMLVSQVVTTERGDMQLPTPDHSQARQKKQPDRLVLNLFADVRGGLDKIKVKAIAKDSRKKGKSIKFGLQTKFTSDALVDGESDRRKGSMRVKGTLTPD